MCATLARDYGGLAVGARAARDNSASCLKGRLDDNVRFTRPGPPGAFYWWEGGIAIFDHRNGILVRKVPIFRTPKGFSLERKKRSLRLREV